MGMTYFVQWVKDRYCRTRECTKKHDLILQGYYGRLSGNDFGDYGYSLSLVKCEKCKLHFLQDETQLYELYPIPDEKWVEQFYQIVIRPRHINEALLGKSELG